MRKPAILVVAWVLAAVIFIGCRRPSQPSQSTPGADSWTTYISPDERVRFDYPSNMRVIVRPRKDERDPDLALSATTPDESIQLTLVRRLSNDLLPNYCQLMMDSLLDENTRAVTAPRDISLANGRGIRQEFREVGGAAPIEIIAVALEAGPAYTHLTCGYAEKSRAELRPMCERIVESLTLKR